MGRFLLTKANAFSSKPIYRSQPSYVVQSRRRNKAKSWRRLAAFWVRPVHTCLYQDLKRSSITMSYRRLIMGPIPIPHNLWLLIEWPFFGTDFKSCLFHCRPIYTFWTSFNTYSRKALGSSGNRSDEIPSNLTPFPSNQLYAKVSLCR